jgi:hypothetical protein
MAEESLNYSADQESFGSNLLFIELANLHHFPPGASIQQDVLNCYHSRSHK